MPAAPRRRWTDRRRLFIYFDGSCLLCRRSAEMLLRFDWLRLLEFVSFRDPHVIKRHRLDPQRLERRMQARPASGGGVREGIDAVILIAARIPLLWPALPLLVLTRWAGVGQRAYDWIAARRHGAGLTIPHPKRPMAPK